MVASPLLVLTSQTDATVTITQAPAAVSTSLTLTDPYPGDTLNVSLVSAAGVQSWVLSLLGTDGNVLASAVTITQATTVGGVATITLPSGLDDFSILLQSQVNNGQNADGTFNSSLTSTTKIASKLGSKNTVALGETCEVDVSSTVRSGYNSKISSLDFGGTVNKNVDAGLISRASFVAFSGNPLAFSTAVTLTDSQDQTKAFSYTSIATGTYQAPVPMLFNSKNSSRVATATNALYHRCANAIGPKTSAYTTALPLSVFCRFRVASNPNDNAHWLWYKSGNTEAAPTTRLGLGVLFDAGVSLAFVCNNTKYVLPYAADYSEHSLLVVISGTQAVIYLDKQPPITITGLTINTLDEPFYLGDIAAFVDTAYGVEYYDFRVYNVAKTQLQAWALASGVY